MSTLGMESCTRVHLVLWVMPGIDCPCISRWIQVLLLPEGRVKREAAKADMILRGVLPYFRGI